jgi:hypothetical protein
MKELQTGTKRGDYKIKESHKIKLASLAKEMEDKNKKSDVNT